MKPSLEVQELFLDTCKNSSHEITGFPKFACPECTPDGVMMVQDIIDTDVKIAVMKERARLLILLSDTIYEARREKR